jgi:hypothetical protein
LIQVASKRAGQMSTGFVVQSVIGLALAGSQHTLLRGTFLGSITQLLAGFCVLLPSIGTTRGEIYLSSVVYLIFMIVLSVREGLQRGTQDISAADHPNFLWPPASFDIGDVYKGFLRGPLLITVSNFSF